MSNVFEFCVGLLNLCLLVFLLTKLFGKTVKAAVKDREREAQERIDDARNMFNEAKAEYDKYKYLIDNLESKKKELLERAQREAEEYCLDTAAKAQAEAQGIVQRAKSDMADAHRLANAELRADIAKATVTRAKAILTANIDEKVHQNVLEKFLAKVGG